MRLKEAFTAAMIAVAPGCVPDAEIDASMAARRVVTLLGNCGCEVEGTPVLDDNVGRDVGFITTEEGGSTRISTYKIEATCKGSANACADSIGTPQVFPYPDPHCGFGPGRANSDGVRRATVTCW